MNKIVVVVVLMVAPFAGCSARSVAEDVQQRLEGVILCEHCGGTHVINKTIVNRAAWFSADYVVLNYVSDCPRGVTCFGGNYKSGGEKFFILFDRRFLRGKQK